MKPLDHIQFDFDNMEATVQRTLEERDRLNTVLADRIARRDAYQEELEDTRLWMTVTPEERELITSCPTEGGRGYHAWYLRLQQSALDGTRFGALQSVYQRRGMVWCSPPVPTAIELYRMLLAIAERLTGRKDIQHVHIGMNHVVYGTGPQGTDEVYHTLYVNGKEEKLIDFVGNTAKHAIRYPALRQYRNDYVQTVVTLHKLVVFGG